MYIHPYLYNSVSSFEDDIGGVTLWWIVVCDLVDTLILKGVGNCRT